ncbi:uncharacterized 12.3 kDa protein in nifK-nifY intergenic region-like [Dermochelys coriacea]|uniref:uncharacterized 12.3 kDa protein in nifK-nifY intergenic region-like n=1 Tax=Dermochelys coriacea TaxID=27794 RepID=UPI0018E7DA2E|nr:uncharacterized 12.3 kDa protein in nifK-nifY intergenic region-like [Dermochelys coriacea]
MRGLMAAVTELPLAPSCAVCWHRGGRDLWVRPGLGAIALPPIQTAGNSVGLPRPTPACRGSLRLLAPASAPQLGPSTSSGRPAAQARGNLPGNLRRGAAEPHPARAGCAQQQVERPGLG